MKNESIIEPAHYEGFDTSSTMSDEPSGEDRKVKKVKPQDYEALLKAYRELLNNHEQLRNNNERLTKAFNQAMTIIGNKYAQEVATAILKQIDEEK